MPEMPGEGAADGPDRPAPAPRLLADTAALTAAAGSAGVLWRLAEPGRQLDANLVRLAPGQRVAPHAEPDLDVLVLVVGGTGTLHADGARGDDTDDIPAGDTPGDTEGDRALAEGALAWLPHGARRALSAGESGLTYLTVHVRRPGMRVRPLRAR